MRRASLLDGECTLATTLPALPIDELLPEVARSLQLTPNLVIEAAPGAGKTTRVPPLLLRLVQGEVLVLEPRRIAARLAARRTALEMGERVGETVGFQVRFEEVSGARTRLRFLTEGVLTRRLLSDPELEGVDAVLLDEFHERHVETDLALALLRRLQARRPGLKLIVMSATLDTGPVAAYLGNCATLRSAGRTFPLEVRYQPYSPLPLERQVAQALGELLHTGQVGHVLVFLPGAAEIRRATRECEVVARSKGAVLLPLYGDLSPEEQDRAIAPSSQQKIILATNLAESSVTIEGVTAVIDCGLARMAAYSPWTGLPMLEVTRISKASAAQRAGRAGRTGPGLCVRLYPQADFAQRPEHDVPEILRSDLASLCLGLRAMSLDVKALDWLDPPPTFAVASAEALLERLRANGESARALARLPVSPRLARMMLEASERGVAEEGVRVAALLSSGTQTAAQDLLTALDATPHPNAERQQHQLRAILRPPRQSRGGEDELLLAVLSGFPDRVARRRAGKQVLLSNGISAELRADAAPYEFMVVLDAEVRTEQAMPLARLISRVEPEWLLDMFPDEVREDTFVEWNGASERVEQVSVLKYGALTLEESRSGTPDPEEAATLLAEKALQLGLTRFVDEASLQQLMERLQLAGIPTPDPRESLRLLCTGMRSFAELREAGSQFIPMLESRAGRALGEVAPLTLKLPGGRSTKVHYETGKPPWIASRLQDFFGMTETPRIGPDKTPVVVHLLAPNHRAVQTTADLRGFWERLYPQVRRELMRRYPRHAWPEDPLSHATRNAR